MEAGSGVKTPGPEWVDCQTVIFPDPFFLWQSRLAAPSLIELSLTAAAPARTAESSRRAAGNLPALGETPPYPPPAGY